MPSTLQDALFYAGLVSVCVAAALATVAARYFVAKGVRDAMDELAGRGRTCEQEARGGEPGAGQGSGGVALPDERASRGFRITRSMVVVHAHDDIPQVRE